MIEVTSGMVTLTCYSTAYIYLKDAERPQQGAQLL